MTAPLFTREDYIRLAKSARKDALHYQGLALDPANARAGRYEELTADFFAVAHRFIGMARYAPAGPDA